MNSTQRCTLAIHSSIVLSDSRVVAFGTTSINSQNSWGRSSKERPFVLHIVVLCRNWHIATGCASLLISHITMQPVLQCTSQSSMCELRLQRLIQPHASLSRLILRHLTIISKADDDEGRAAAGTKVWEHSQASCSVLQTSDACCARSQHTHSPERESTARNQV